jgi:type I restriction enzyme R subunit
LNTALAIDEIVMRHARDENEQTVIEWQTKSNLTGRMKIEIEDYLIDEVKGKYDIPMSFDEIDQIIDSAVNVAKLRIK